jgi:ubiquitin-conjugating enzyme E2 Q
MDDVAGRGGPVPTVRLDPKFKLTIAREEIGIPEPSHGLERTLRARRAECAADADENDADDAAVFEHADGRVHPALRAPAASGMREDPIDVDDDPDDFDESWALDVDDDDAPAPRAGPSTVPVPAPAAKRVPPADDWKHDAQWVQQAIVHLMPPPIEASPMASKALQRELKAMLKEQDAAGSLRELGWYMPPEIVENNDNLFQWIVGRW